MAIAPDVMLTSEYRTYNNEHEFWRGTTPSMTTVRRLKEDVKFRKEATEKVGWL
jgi:hypothetical protein